jgi:hypothetical protein
MKIRSLHMNHLIEITRRHFVRLSLASLALLVPGASGAEPTNWTDAEIAARLHAPIVAAEGATTTDIFTPRPYTYVEPRPLALPSTEDLKTVTIRDREYTIRRTARWPAGMTPEKAKAEGLALYEKNDEALFFLGSGGGGLKSRERLVVEDCTFVLDFQQGDFEKWDAKRCAICVEGYKEVLVRNCVFVSKTLMSQEIRRTVGSVLAYDCQKVQVEECFFAGRTTGWRGHVLVFCCGPTAIRNIEVRGLKQGDQWACGGGIWVASGVGEGKIGWVHQDNPELMIYPPGPLLVENAWVHDQIGRENNDGIYVQSVQPFLVRNSKVENWRDDSLMDVSFRDSGGKGYDGKKLVNHGGVGVVENCEFRKGSAKSFVKNSVGAGGGIVFRNNVFQDVWVMPYIFDGGGWWFAGNEFIDLSGAAICGDDGRGGGWEPGMFQNGSAMYFYNNLFRARPGAKPNTMMVTKNAAALIKGVRMDYNVYDLNSGSVGAWLMEEQKERKAVCKSFAEWQKASGADEHSVLGKETLDVFKAVRPDTVKLPGGLPMTFGAAKAGLTGPVGVTNPKVLAKAKALCDAFEKGYAAANAQIEIEDMAVLEKTAGLTEKLDKRGWYGGGAARFIEAKEVGESIKLEFKIEAGGRFRANVSVVKGEQGACEYLVDDKPLAKEPVQLEAGAHKLTCKVVQAPARIGLDRLSLVEFSEEQEAAQQNAAQAKAAATTRAAALDAAKLKMDIAQLSVTEKHGVVGDYPRKGGGNYRLFMAKVGESVTMSLEVPKTDSYDVSLALTAQQDKGKLQVLVDGKEIGPPANLTGNMPLGSVQLAEGKHSITFKIVAVAKEGEQVKIRLNQLVLVPSSAARAVKAEAAAEKTDDEAPRADR